MLTRVFKSGNSLAVRIPKELAVTRPSLVGIGDIFAMFSSNFMASGREFESEWERDWGNTDDPTQKP